MMVGRSNTIRELFVYRSVTRRTTRARGRCKGSKKRTCERLPRLLSARRRMFAPFGRIVEVDMISHCPRRPPGRAPMLRHGTELSRCSDSHFTVGQGRVTEQLGSSAPDDPEPMYRYRATDVPLSSTCVRRPSDQFSYCRFQGGEPTLTVLGFVAAPVAPPAAAPIAPPATTPTGPPTSPTVAPVAAPAAAPPSARSGCFWPHAASKVRDKTEATAMVLRIVVSFLSIRSETPTRQSQCGGRTG